MKSEKGTNVVPILSITGKSLTTAMLITADSQAQNHSVTFGNFEVFYIYKTELKDHNTRYASLGWENIGKRKRRNKRLFPF